jgi:hypothetical protein
MATTLIRNGAFSGALGALTEGRAYTSAAPSDYAANVNAADAFASEFLTQNAALTVPMADADNAEIGQLCESAAYAQMAGRATGSTTATDYATVAGAAVALAKEGVAKLV